MVAVIDKDGSERDAESRIGGMKDNTRMEVVSSYICMCAMILNSKCELCRVNMRVARSKWIRLCRLQSACPTTESGQNNQNKGYIPDKSPHLCGNQPPPSSRFPMLFAAQYVKASRLRTTASACSVEASGIVKLAPLNVVKSS